MSSSNHPPPESASGGHFDLLRRATQKMMYRYVYICFPIPYHTPDRHIQSTFTTPRARLLSRELPFHCMCSGFPARQTGLPCHLVPRLRLPSAWPRISRSFRARPSRCFTHGRLLEHPSLRAPSQSPVYLRDHSLLLLLDVAGRHSCRLDWAGILMTHPSVSMQSNKAGLLVAAGHCGDRPSLQLTSQVALLSSGRLAKSAATCALCLILGIAWLSLYRQLPGQSCLSKPWGLPSDEISDEHVDFPAALTAPSKTIAFTPALPLEVDASTNLSPQFSNTLPDSATLCQSVVVPAAAPNMAWCYDTARHVNKEQLICPKFVNCIRTSRSTSQEHRPTPIIYP